MQMSDALVELAARGDETRRLLRRLDRKSQAEVLSSLGFHTVGQRARMLQAVRLDAAACMIQEAHRRARPPQPRHRSAAAAKPICVTLIGRIDSVERRLVARLSPEWQQHRVRDVIRYFRKKKLGDVTQLNERRLVLVRAESDDAAPAAGHRLLDPAARVGDAMVDGDRFVCLYPPIRDQLATGNPYFLPLDNTDVLAKARRRDPRHVLTAAGTALDTTAPPRFDVASEREAWSAYLDAHGYAVLRNALDDEAVHRARDLFWHFMERLSTDPLPGAEDADGHAADPLATDANGGPRQTRRQRVSRHDPSTWHWDANEVNGVVLAGGIGQSAFLWHVRTQPNVLAAFAHLWGVEPSDLVTSFDGCSTFRPPSVCAEWRTLSNWWHVDQNKHGRRRREGRAAVQGLVSLYDQSLTTGAFAALPGTHQQFDDVCERYADEMPERVRGGPQFMAIRGADPLLAGHEARLVSCRAGDLVLWDSRMVHCSVAATGRATDGGAADGGSGDEGGGDATGIVGGGGGSDGSDGLAGETSTPQLLRLVAYVCMMPASSVPREVLERRRMHWHFGATTTHWPDAWEARFPRQREEVREREAARDTDTPGACCSDDEGICDDADGPSAEPGWVPLELSSLPRSALRLIGWQGMDDEFYATPPSLQELRPVFGRWARAHEEERL